MCKYDKSEIVGPFDHQEECKICSLGIKRRDRERCPVKMLTRKVNKLTLEKISK